MTKRKPRKTSQEPPLKEHGKPGSSKKTSNTAWENGDSSAQNKVEKRQSKCLKAKDDNSREKSHENCSDKDKSDNRWMEGNDLSKISLQNETFRNNDHQPDIAEGDAEGVEESGEEFSLADQKHIECLDGTAEDHCIESPIMDEIHECKYGISDMTDMWPPSCGMYIPLCDHFWVT